MDSFLKKLGGSGGVDAALEEVRIPSYSNEPDRAWELEKSRQKVQMLPLKDWTAPHVSSKPEGHTRFVCISGMIEQDVEALSISFHPPPADTHGKTSDLKVPEADVLLHTGDFSNVGLPGDVQKFADFLTSQPHPHKVGIFIVMAAFFKSLPQSLSPSGCDSRQS